MVSSTSSSRSLRFRLLRDEDGEALVSLHRRAILATSLAFYSVEERASWAAGLRPDGYADSVRDGETIEVVVGEADVPLGFCGRKPARIEGLYVDPDWQRGGLGSQLLARAEAALLTAGATEITVDASRAALAFYERNGFESDHLFMQKTRGGLEIATLRMVKRLS